MREVLVSIIAVPTVSRETEDGGLSVVGFDLREAERSCLGI